MNRLHAEKTNRPKLYLRGGDPVRVKRGEEDDLVTQELTVDHVQYELTNAAEHFNMPAKSDPKLVYPPRDVARYVLSAPTHTFPKLEGIVHAPVLRRDGSILKERGYDAETGLILDPPAGFEVDVPDEPTEEDVAAAKKIIGELLNDLPFADKASLANLIAFGFTQPLRETIDGPTPLCAVDKPSPGSGASLLIEVLSHATTGREAGAMGFTERDGEQRKQIRSKLRNGDPILFFDNVGTTLDSASIARALTASLWEDRILGVSRTLRVPIRNSWCATGNNLTISTEIARRCFWVRLDARVEKPWERDLKQFSHPDLRGWAKTNRSKILGAFLTIGRYWFAEGQPVPQDAVSLGSFESWSRVMSGVLHAAGIEGFLGNRDQLYEKTTDSTGLWSTFVAAWHD